MSRITRCLVAALAVLAIASLTSCGNDNSGNPLVPVFRARVMAVHASPDTSTNIDLLVDGIVAARDLKFLENSGYLPVTAGTRNVRMNVADTTITLINTDLSMTVGGSYSVFASGPMASIGALVIADDLTPPAVGKAHVRFIHLSPDAPALDVAITGGPVLFANRAFRQSSDFIALDARTYDLEVRPAGSGSVLLALPGLVPQAGRIYTVLVKGYVAGVRDLALGAQIIVNN